MMKKIVCTWAAAGALSLMTITPASARAASNLCPAQHEEFKSAVDVTLDNLSTEQLTALADKGRADAMVLLALRLGPAPENADNANAPAPDMEKALSLLQRAVDKKNADAAYLMGAAYANGLMNLPMDEAKAVYWLERGAKLGSPIAQYWYGEMLAKGRGGLASDWKAASAYFNKAAKRGVPDAFLELGYMYVYGLGGEDKNPQKGAFCYRQILSKTPLARYSLRRLIEEGSVIWQPGDPGKPLDTPSDNSQAPAANKF